MHKPEIRVQNKQLSSRISSEQHRLYSNMVQVHRLTTMVSVRAYGESAAALKEKSSMPWNGEDCKSQLIASIVPERSWEIGIPT